MPERHRCTAAGSLHAAAATHAWTASKDRAAATLHPARTTPHQPSCRRPGANPRSRTEISLGARAHTATIDRAIAAHQSSAARSALRAARRGDRSPLSALNRKDVEDSLDPDVQQKAAVARLTRGACTDKQHGSARRRQDHPPRATQTQHARPASHWKSSGLARHVHMTAPGYTRLRALEVRRGMCIGTAPPLASRRRPEQPIRRSWSAPTRTTALLATVSPSS